MTTTTQSTATISKPTGFGELPCPKCGAEAAIRLDLDDLDTFSCGECDQSYTLGDVTRWIDRWTRVIAKSER